MENIKKYSEDMKRTKNALQEMKKTDGYKHLKKFLEVGYQSQKKALETVNKDDLGKTQGKCQTYREIMDYLEGFEEN